MRLEACRSGSVKCIWEIPVEVYVMNADGSDQKRLTNDSARDFWVQPPSWSPFLGSEEKE